MIPLVHKPGLGFLSGILPNTQLELQDMEEPIRVDVYGKIVLSCKKQAIAYLEESGIYKKSLDVRLAINNSTREKRFTVLAKSLGYDEAVFFAASCDWADDITFTQEMYFPGGDEGFCKIHNLHFGGILGCHVCSGFYQK